MDSLCSNMLSDNEQLRDISSIGEYEQGLVTYCLSVAVLLIYL